MGRPTPASGLLGVVFAGGRSERMGEDKALLPWPGADGHPIALFEHAARTLTQVAGRVEVAAGSNGRLQIDGWATFPDEESGAGPLAGLLAALERAETLGLDAVLALACDMPLVRPEDLSPLVRALGENPPADAAMWVVEGRDQPLCAVYGTACAKPARRAFEGGKRRVVALFDPSAQGARPLGLVRVLADQNSARRLVNLNTRSDYDRALADR